MNLLTAVAAFESWAVGQDQQEVGWTDSCPGWTDVYKAVEAIVQRDDPVDAETLSAIFKVLLWDEEGEGTKEMLLASPALARQVVFSATHKEPEEVRYQVIDLAVRLGERDAVRAYLTDYSMRIRGRAERYLTLGQDV